MNDKSPNDQPEAPDSDAPPKHDEAPNPFDPARLRLAPNYTATLGVKKVLMSLPCRKPNRHEWVRVRPGEDWRLQTAVFEDKVLRETYLVEPDLVVELLGEVRPVCLFLAVNRQNDPFFWLVKLPGEDGRTNPWNVTAMEAAQLARTQWIRVAANLTAGYYDVFETHAEIPDPQWPEMELSALLEICFRDRFIRDRDHEALKRLRGEA